MAGTDYTKLTVQDLQKLIQAQEGLIQRKIKTRDKMYNDGQSYLARWTSKSEKDLKKGSQAEFNEAIAGITLYEVIYGIITPNYLGKISGRTGVPAKYKNNNIDWWAPGVKNLVHAVGLNKNYDSGWFYTGVEDDFNNPDFLKNTYLGGYDEEYRTIPQRNMDLNSYNSVLTLMKGSLAGAINTGQQITSIQIKKETAANIESNKNETNTRSIITVVLVLVAIFILYKIIF
jgi:hypothetical protein